MDMSSSELQCKILEFIDTKEIKEISQIEEYLAPFTISADKLKKALRMLDSEKLVHGWILPMASGPLILQPLSLTAEGIKRLEELKSNNATHAIIINNHGQLIGNI